MGAKVAKAPAELVQPHSKQGWAWGECWGPCLALPSPALPYLAHEVLASLPLQMMLYFNACYFPFWCLGEGMMLQLKVLSGGQVRGGAHRTGLMCRRHGKWRWDAGRGTQLMGPHTWIKMPCPTPSKKMEIMRATT